MFCLNVNFIQRRLKIEKILFKKLKLCKYVTTTAAYSSRDAPITANKIKLISHRRGRGKFSLYSANNIMTHFKELCIMDYDIIGFDLDGTLLRYDLNHMVPLEYELLTKFMVNEKNYPKALLGREFDKNFVQKGLIIDASHGNILKLSEDCTILKAAHGTKFLTEEEICEVYGASRKYDIIQTFVNDPLSAWNGPIAERVRTLLDYFDIGVSLAFARTVDVLDELSPSENILKKSDYKIWPDILAGLVKIYSREHFANGQSAYFEALKRNPDKYLIKTDAKVIEFLGQLKAAGKALFLLTGSNIDFANFTAFYALGPQWQELFDYTITYAKKPGFFYMQRQFLKVENLIEIEGSEIALREVLEPNNFYCQGNWQQLKESLCKRVLNKNVKEVRSLYVGDNLIQDIYAPNVVASIDTLAVIEELLENDVNYNFKAIVQSPLWGSYFSYDSIPTLWSKFIEKYSKLCVSNMSVLAEIPVKDKIYCKNKEGYYPHRPEGLSVN